MGRCQNVVADLCVLILSRGALGNGSTHSNYLSPNVVEKLAGLKVKSIAAGGWHSCAITGELSVAERMANIEILFLLTEFGDLYCWGWNESGQLGLNPVKVQCPLWADFRIDFNCFACRQSQSWNRC